MSEQVAVIVPWQAGCPWRERALAWVTARYREHHPSWPVILGRSTSELFSRTQAILDGASRTMADVLVIADGDVWCPLDAAVEQAAAGGWAIPHLLIHRLSDESTDLVLDGADWHGLPLSRDNAQDQRPYKGHEGGTLLVVHRDAFDTAPPDPRFVGWGQEDSAWALALRNLVGAPWRGREDLVHLWHPPQQRLTRVIGSERSRKLQRRYVRASRDRDAMAALVAEAKEVLV